MENSNSNYGFLLRLKETVLGTASFVLVSFGEGGRGAGVFVGGIGRIGIIGRIEGTVALAVVARGLLIEKVGIWILFHAVLLALFLLFLVDLDNLVGA